MRNLPQLSPTNWITAAGFAAVIGLLSLITLNGLIGMGSTQRQLDQLVSANSEKLRQITIMRRANRERVIGLQRMLLLEDSSDVDAEAISSRGHVNHFIQARSRLQELSGSQAERDALDLIRARSAAAAPLNDRIRELVADGKLVEARRLMLDELVAAQDALYHGFESLAAIYEKQAALTAQRAHDEFASAQRRTLWVYALAVLVSLFVAVHVVRCIGRTELALRWQSRELESEVRSSAEELRAENQVREHAEELARQEQERLQVTLASIGDGVLTVSPTGCVDYLNPAAEAITGWSAEEAMGLELSSVLTARDADSALPRDLFRQASKSGTADAAIRNELRIERPDGEQVDVEATVARITNADVGAGALQGLVVVLRDVTETRALARRLAHQATHDALTGLVNRREFERRVEAALSQARLAGEPALLAFLDLDQFKVVNDSCGHVGGDRLLKELSDKLSHKLRPDDTLARLGGDEFGLLLVNCNLANGLAIAEKIRASVEDYRLLHDGKVFSVGTSIGVVELKPDCGSLTEALSMADAACYLAKDRGRNCVQVYTEGDDVFVQRQGEMRWSTVVSSALDEGWFELHCQPIVPVFGDARNESHYEILLRMRDEDGQLVFPGQFIPAAERYGQLTRIDRYVIREALAWLGQHQDAGVLDRISINVSGASVSEEQFLDEVIRLINISGAKPERIIFEITENVATTDPQAAAAFIAKLREIGCEFALDDFGQGFSSLSKLKDLAVDYLKIDGQFVRDIVNDRNSQAMVRGINEIAHALGKRTVAEFVENEETLALIRDIGIDYVQGFGIARPAPLEDLLTDAARDSSFGIVARSRDAA